jgi:hypothetical protein
MAHYKLFIINIYVQPPDRQECRQTFGGRPIEPTATAFCGAPRLIQNSFYASIHWLRSLAKPNKWLRRDAGHAMRGAMDQRRIRSNLPIEQVLILRGANYLILPMNLNRGV